MASQFKQVLSKVNVRVLPNINTASAVDIQSACCQIGQKLSQQVVDHIKEIGCVTSWDQLVMDGFPAGGKRIKALQLQFSLDTTTTIVKAKKLNINMASVEDLMEIPGIGITLSKKIFEYINEIGGIEEMDDLIDVIGNGKRLQSLKDFCVCGKYVSV